jgi:hypothetical protein
MTSMPSVASVFEKLSPKRLSGPVAAVQVVTAVLADLFRAARIGP